MTETKEKEVKEVKEVKSPFDRGKTEPASKAELAARKEMFVDQAKYDKLFFDMNHPEGTTTKTIEAYIRTKKEDLEIAKKKWNRSINKHSRLRELRR